MLALLTIHLMYIQTSFSFSIPSPIARLVYAIVTLTNVGLADVFGVRILVRIPCLCRVTTMRNYRRNCL